MLGIDFEHCRLGRPDCIERFVQLPAAQAFDLLQPREHGGVVQAGSAAHAASAPLGLQRTPGRPCPQVARPEVDLGAGRGGCAEERGDTGILHTTEALLLIGVLDTGTGDLR